MPVENTVLVNEDNTSQTKSTTLTDLLEKIESLEALIKEQDNKIAEVMEVNKHFLYTRPSTGVPSPEQEAKDLLNKYIKEGL